MRSRTSAATPCVSTTRPVLMPPSEVSPGGDAAVTSPHLPLYMDGSGAGFGWVPTPPEAPKRRHRADDAARTGDRFHHCAGSRAHRAVFHRLEPVPPAV